MKSFIFSTLFLMSTSLVAQTKLGSVREAVPTDDFSSFETQRDELAGFLNVVQRFEQLDMIGLTGPCETEDVVIAMAHGLSKSQMVAPDPRVAGTIAYDIADLASQVHGIVQTVMASDCAPKANNKCCKKSSEADKSDVCNDKTDKYCKLTGIGIKGCTENSDDC